MPDILVVDDSAVERTVIVAFLKRQFPNSNVLEAYSGPEALGLLDSRRFDLVLTDLRMPDMDGCELVEEIQNRGFDVPVVLMTGFGNEHTAMQALRAGAANYVPKRELNHLLVATIESVLSKSQSHRTKARMMSYMTAADFRFTIANDNTLIAPLIEHVQDQIRSMRLLEERDVVRMAIALHEVLTNAIMHGNLEVSSDLRQQDESLFHALANERREQAPYCLRDVFVNVELSATEIRFTVRDQGPGFDVSKMMDPERSIDLDRIGGRGLLLVKSFSDVVFHNESGNEITLVKFLTADRAYPRSPSVESTIPTKGRAPVQGPHEAYHMLATSV